ncbi:helix-turn-helix domain-containing protein [Streptomyces anulatus]|uniref:helix-turn-helix domain-containing protein n=1 Tax=Streptomyces anulatus TaxID=1892 RepID=UPI0004C998B5|nr:helix-turn-helix domain-containing protein [Streptomyces anulatus]
MALTPLAPKTRLVGEARVEYAAELAKHYNNNASIRTLMAASGRSYGFVHKLLEEAGVTFRRRGGVRRTRLSEN